MKKKTTKRLPKAPHLVKLHVNKKKIVAVVPGGFVNELMTSPPIHKVEVVGPVTEHKNVGPWIQMWRDFCWYFK